MILKRSTLIIFFFASLTIKIISQTTFKNPIITGMNPDPSICRVGDDFYLVTSTFEYFPGLPIYQSKDLVHWKMIGYVLARASNCPLGGAGSSGGNYAPAIRYHNGIFYVSCTNYGGKGTQGAFYVTAKKPAGPWSDPVWVGNWNVDPSIMFTNDSMYWVSPDNNGSFMIGTMNPATGKFIKPLKKIASGLGGSSPEGPHMYKINDYYYLMSAEGGTGYQHREVIQRSKSPWGPFEASPVNPVVSNMNNPESPFQAIGHADMFQLKDGSWWLVCLGFRPKDGKHHHLGRETFLAPVIWDANGWPKGGINGVVNEEFPKPNLPSHIWEKEPVRDNFESLTLRLPWNFIRNPYDADWSLTEKPGYLRLKGSKVSLKEKDSPAFIGRRQTAFNIAASTKINFTPVAPNEEAGLVIRGNDANHFDFLVTLLDGKRVVMLRKYLKDKAAGVNYKEIPDGDIILRISATELEYSFWFQKDGKTAELLGTAATKDISTEAIGGFTGAYVGMYASGNGKTCTNPADFDWFDFEEDPATPYEWTVTQNTKKTGK
jgi:alpha-N-arabinofuranosidase